MTDGVAGVAGVSWAQFAAQAPEMAAFARERLEAHRHRTMATIRADGSPRISGTELTIHSGSDDPPRFQGDARLSGVVIFVEDEAVKAAFLEAAGGGPPGPFELVRLAITEASTVREAATHDHLVIEAWRPGQPVRRIERY